MKKKEKKASILENFISLTFLQVINFLVPLLTIPYLTRVLGVAGYGQVAFIQITISFFVLFVEFGFPWSAVRDVSRLRDDRHRLSEVSIAIMVVQWALLIISFACLSIFFYLFTVEEEIKNFLYIGFGMVVGGALFPIWLFSGLELMRQMAIIQFISKIILLVPIFIFVKTSDDIDNYLLILSMGSVLAGVIALYYIYYKKIIKFILPKNSLVLEQVKSGYLIFPSRIAISCYTILVPLMVGLISGPGQLAIYSLADRVRSASLSIFGVASQAIFPRINFYESSNTNSLKKLIKKYTVLSLFSSVIVGILIYLLSEKIIKILGGDNFIEAASVLKYFSALPFFVTVSNILGIQVMIPKFMNKQFNFILIGAAIFGLIISYPLIRIGGADGGAQVVLIVEGLIALIMVIYLRVYRIFYSRNL